MDQEKIKILKLIEDRKITAAEAVRLLDALEEPAPKAEGKAAERGPVPAQQLKLKVSDLDTGRVRVNLSIPVGIAHIVQSLIPPQEFKKLEEQGFRINAVLEAIHGGMSGKIFEAEDVEHGKHVVIFIE